MLDTRTRSGSAGRGDREGTKRADEGIAPGRRTLVDALGVAPPAVAASSTEELASATDSSAELVAQPAARAGVPPGTTAASSEQAASTTTLSAAQTADAIRYHTSQYWKYTKQVVTDIQNGVGVTATGVMNAETVQAIAARQAAVNVERTPSPPLKVDGKAGPRTLPILIPVGLATDEAIDKYTTDIQGDQDKIEKAATPEARAAIILDEINDRLEQVKVPRIEKKVKIDTGSLNEFGPADWEMTMGTAILADPKTAGAAAATMYHEARHAEQAFRVARMLRGQGRSLAQIKVQVPISGDVLTEDMKSIDPGTTEAAEAQGWHEPEPGRMTDDQQRARRKARLKQFRDAAIAAGQDDAKLPAAAAAYKAFLDGQEVDYRDTPTEYDSFFVGEKVSDKLGIKHVPFNVSNFPPLKDAIDMIVKDPTLGGLLEP